MTRDDMRLNSRVPQTARHWVVYPFRYKPQELNQPPRIYAPYQPRFDWNLWFASLGSWREYPIVTNTEVRLLSNDQDVLALFAGNPFPSNRPARFGLCFGSTGSPPWRKNARRECGGGGNFWACTRRRWSAHRMATLRLSNGPPCSPGSKR